jgi:hypothetical protein
MNQQRESLKAEIATVRGLLAMIPEDLVIDRASLTSRIENLEARLRECEEVEAPPRVELYFAGEPVIGTRGIESTFAAAVLDKYSQAVHARAADMRGRLKPHGPMPMRSSHKLFFTQRLAGSFGFALEAMPEDLEDEDVQTLRAAISSVDAVIDGSLRGDEQLAESIGSAQPRVLALVREFLSKVASSRAHFRISDQGRVVEALGYASVEAAAERLQRTHAEETVALRGWLLGILPENRRFEFEEDGERRIVRTGGIDDEIDSEGIERIDNECLHKRCEARFRVTRVGSGTRWVRYLLLEIKAIRE